MAINQSVARTGSRLTYRRTGNPGRLEKRKNADSSPYASRASHQHRRRAGIDGVQSTAGGRIARLAAGHRRNEPIGGESDL